MLGTKALIAAVFAILMWIVFSTARADQVKSTTCAVLSRFGGQVQLLDATRTNLIETAPKIAVSCGSWISVDRGWALVHYRDGYSVHVGSNSFLQVTDGNPEGHAPSDHLVLYKGFVYAEVMQGDGEFRVVTANARARVKNGKSMIIYNAGEEETQLVALENTQSLENRFESHTKIVAKSGEATSLNLKSLRLVPTTPKAVALSGLKGKLADLHLHEKDQMDAFKVAKTRQDRKFASVVVDEHAPKVTHTSRDKKSYVRNKNDAVDAHLKEHLVKRTVANVKDGEEILYPNRYYGKVQNAKVEVQKGPVEVEGSQIRGLDKNQDAERAKLIEELSKIRPE